LIENNVMRINALLSLTFDILGIGLPGWTADFNAALSQYAEPENSADDALKIPMVSSLSLDLIESYSAVVLLAFIDAGLPLALARMILSCTNGFVTTRATILLWSVLDLASKILPPKSLAVDIKSFLIDRTIEDTSNPAEDGHIGTRSRARLALM